MDNIQNLYNTDMGNKGRLVVQNGSHKNVKEIERESTAGNLTLNDWIITVLIVAVVALGLPRTWSSFEDFSPESAYRIPHLLSEDYWHFTRYAGIVAQESSVVVVGDSVIWGEYAPSDETLPHYLTIMTGLSFRNLGVKGTHPVSLDGLLRYHGQPLREKHVIMHFNPLWMSTPRHDLSEQRESHFNHPALVPQLWPRIPGYQANLDKRLDILAARYMPFRGFSSHIAIAYYENKTPPLWALEHPYELPFGPLLSKISMHENDYNQDPRPWTERDMQSGIYDWVAPDTSLQWLFFQKSILLMRNRGNRVFVLIGPFNEHIMDNQSQKGYETIINTVCDWLSSEGCAYFIASPLAGRLYADASHPFGEGYAQIARELSDATAFRTFLHTAANANGKNLLFQDK